MKVEIWSDVVCPWCYIGKRRFEEALSRFEHRDQVEVVWRAFELDPSAPRTRPGSHVAHLAAKYQMSPAEAQAMIDRVVAAAADNGLDFHFDIAQPGNTFDAHRLLHLALERGVQGAVKERFMAGNFTEGAAIGDPLALTALAVEAGLDRDQVRWVLESDAYGDDVRADEQWAARLGISAVPFFVVNEKYGVSGAQPPEMLARLLEDAWREEQTTRRAGAVIQRVGVADTIGLRQRVLRPHQTVAEMRYPHDDDPATGHFAAMEGDEIIGTVSVVPEPPTVAPADLESWWRLRGMATAEEHRSQGVGSALVTAAVAHVVAEGGRGLWCNARLPAVAFYERAGFATVGERWEEPGIGPHVVMWRPVP